MEFIRNTFLGNLNAMDEKKSKICNHKKYSTGRTDEILSEILTQARSLANADAGSIYLPFEVNGEKFLQLRVAQNDTLSSRLNSDNNYSYSYLSVPVNQSSISGYVALSGKMLNIEDVYKLPADCKYSFNKAPDINANYHTTSMLTYPLNSSDGKLLAVLQLINAKDNKDKVIPFSEEIKYQVTSYISSHIIAVLEKCLASTDRFQQLIEIEKDLAKIKDKSTLLEQILTITRQLVHADAGSIYQVIKGKNEKRLQIMHGQNDTRQNALKPGEKLPYTNFDFPINDKSICGWVALNKQALHIEDVYSIPADSSYKFNSSSDLITNYKTTSMYTAPILSANGDLIGVLQIINALDENHNVIPFTPEAMDFIDKLAVTVTRAIEKTQIIEDSNKKVLKMAELRDPSETYPHVERVAQFALEIYDYWAFKHNVSEEVSLKFKDNLSIAARFHDIGKVGISDVILKKPGKFTPEERIVMNNHTLLGAAVFDSLENPTDYDLMAKDINFHHHEWWNGGEKKVNEQRDNPPYPGKVDLSQFDIANPTIPPAQLLKGEEIPLAARIASIADVFDALAHPRCYKPAWSIEDAIAEIKKYAGYQFDPELVDCFMARIERIKAINEAIS